MKKFLLASTALAMLSGIGVASAADLPSRKGPPMAPVYIPPAFTWTGFYVGVNAGYAWADNNNNNNLYTPYIGYSSGGNSGGFIGGAQAGYNYQFGLGSGVVIGAEADIQYVDLGKKNNNLYYAPVGYYPTSNNSSGNYLGTVRARLGYGFDRFLVYATGGLAYGDVGGGSNAGWTVGGGVEYAIWQNWTVKAEYLYYNLGHNNNNDNLFTGVVGPYYYGGKTKDNAGNIIRVGVNYKFW